ncbi:9438_t:CDS:1, partial [Cetraspora pellucida]
MSFQKETNEDAIKLHKTELPENRLKAFKIFEENKCNYWLGYYHEQGYANLKIDIKKACNYYLLAVLEDNADAAYRLTAFKLKENTFNTEEEKTFNKLFITLLFKKSADLGHIDACFNYDDILVNGKLENKKDIETGKKYLIRASGKDHEKAYNLLIKLEKT